VIASAAKQSIGRRSKDGLLHRGACHRARRRRDPVAPRNDCVWPSSASITIATYHAPANFTHHFLSLRTTSYRRAPEPTADAVTPAVTAFTLKPGVCQDYAHVFIACARSGGIPARFVSGHFLRSDGMVNQAAGHAWAEAFVPDLGWIGFDPANSICTTDAHAR